MDPAKISSFAQLLKDNGDKVLNSGFKLTLSGPLLRALNDSFVCIIDQNEPASSQKEFQVVKTDNSKSEAIRDLQFIHDFVQKTLILCMTTFPADDPFDGVADITKFRNLHRLEIQRFPVNQITGIQKMRSRLEELVCVRKSINCVKEIISDCGGDNSNGFVWNELKTADFSYNSLTVIDYTTFVFVPWLQHLNLSHNQIVSVDAIKWLKHLKVLDISFNKLTYVPTFNAEASKRLQSLYLSNNFIEDLSGIARLEALTELDLSGNCFIEHSVLGPISTLVALRYLNLVENPLAFFPKHREITVKYLNRNTSSVKFILDHEPLTKYEKSLIGSVNLSFYRETWRNSTHSLRTSSIQNSPRITPISSVGSISSMHADPTTDLNSSVTSQNRRSKIRKPKIEDHGKIEEKPVNIMEKSLEGNKEHLETKKELENLRNKYGDNWLRSPEVQSGIMGAQYVAVEVEKRDAALEMIDDYLQTDTDSKISKTPVTTQPEPMAESFKHGLVEKITEIRSSTPISQSPLIVSTPATVDEIKVEEITDPTLNPYYVPPVDNTPVTVYSYSNEPEDISDPEENELSYDVTLEPTGDQLYLIVSDVSIREKFISSGSTKTKWPMAVLESCERIKSDIIRINFDTRRRDKKQRTYKMSDRHQCHALEQSLRDILSKRDLTELNQKVFRCFKCSTQFSREMNNNKSNKDVKCPQPDCRSAFVVELNDTAATKLPTPVDKPRLSEFKVEKPSTSGETLPKSASQNSIGSVGSLNESSSCSKISNSESSFDSNQSVAGSSSNERDRDPDIMFGKNGTESDVEILSNPSQSSIEILDSLHSSRKHSEERRISQIPTLDTISDDNLSNCYNLSTTLTDQCTSTQDDLTHSSELLATTLKAPPIAQITSLNPNPDNENQLSATIVVEEMTIQPSEAIDEQNKTERKNNLVSVTSGIAAHLTESSSSGSVTDSICTAYEQNQGKSNDEITGNETKTNVLTDSGNLSKGSEDSSMISSVLNNLLQTTNLLLSKSQKSGQSNDSLLDQQFDPYEFSYTNFTEVDHRIKLYLYQTIFEDANENFKWLVKGKFLDESVLESHPHGFDGFFILSTMKCYVLKIVGSTADDDPSKWLKRYMAVSVDRLDQIKVLPWKIGLEITIKGVGILNLLLHDILRTDSFLLHISSNLPDTCTIEYQVSEILLKKLSTLTDGDKIEMFGILKSCEIMTDDSKIFREYCTIVVTATTFYLGKNFRWLFTTPSPLVPVDCCIEVFHKQDMTNLVEYKKMSNVKYVLYFLDDSTDKCENWEVVFETETFGDSTLMAICSAWEKLFDVPLTSN